MKTVVLAIILTLTSSVFATQLSTQDNRSYIIAVLNYSMWNSCAKITCEVAKVSGYGNGQCQILPITRIIITNLTSKGVEHLQRMSSCRFAIRLEGQMYTQPRLGTSN